jgi:hypothetical protein
MFMMTPNNALKHCSLHAALCCGVILLCLGLSARSDELQDASKLFKQGQRAQALAQVESYLANKPKDAQARFLKGLILTDEGKTDDAIRVFSDLTEDYPELPEPYNNLAVLYAGQGQYDKARIALEMAIRTHPSYATAHENLGDIYAKMASQAYERALQLDRGNTGTQTKLELINKLFTSDVAASKPVKPAIVAAATATAPASASELNTSAQPAKSAAAKDPKIHNNPDEVLKTVQAWAAAWSAKDAKRYLSFYASDFKVPGGQNRSEWESFRTKRLSIPKSIHVAIDDAKVDFPGASHAIVTFRQSLKAGHYRAHDRKTLEMIKSGDRWLILEEHSGK